MSTALRKDSLIGYGAGAAQRAVASQKKYRAIMSVSQPTASRHMNGDPYSPATKFLARIAEDANAFPFVAEAICIVNQVQIRKASTRVLEIRLEWLDENEHTTDMLEDRHTLRLVAHPTVAQLKEAAAADVAQAEVLLERAAIRRELAERMRLQ